MKFIIITLAAAFALAGCATQAREVCGILSDGPKYCVTVH